MQHRIKGRKHSRSSSARKALLMNLALSLIEHEQIITTLPKAKDLRSYVEKLITIGQKNTLHARRILIARLGSETLVSKVLGELRTRYEQRPGGYTRVLKAGFRKGDNAAMAVIELVDRNVSLKKAPLATDASESKSA